ncbi:hypothetical protein [Shinella sp.]|uniref:hypothetical protein n=1 Tax=Shinella sp. TaxID=1870904 RepID=UPI003D290458
MNRTPVTPEEAATAILRIYKAYDQHAAGSVLDERVFSANLLKVMSADEGNAGIAHGASAGWWSTDGQGSYSLTQAGANEILKDKTI